MALLHLAQDWAGGQGVLLVAATVDHGLRPEAADEAAMVAKTCAALGIPHETLRWSGWDGQGNLQDAARRARYSLLAGWAQEMQLDAVALGHTRDDQAETFLMRLARGSGVDGLATMREDWAAQNVRWLRPMLAVPRQGLRDYLTGRGGTWVEDPSNEDTRFGRVKTRRALEVLAPMGLDADRLVQTAQSMARARSALQFYAQEAARLHCQTQSGDVLISSNVRDLPEEIRNRLFAHALVWVSSAQYRPRFDALVEAWAGVQAGTRRSLHGCLISPEDGLIRISREYQAVKEETCAPDQLWDRRWRLSGNGSGGQIGALGEALKEVADWRETGLPRASLMASPAIWQGDVLIAAPVAGLKAGWSAQVAHPQGDFLTSILSH